MKFNLMSSRQYTQNAPSTRGGFLSGEMDTCPQSLHISAVKSENLVCSADCGIYINIGISLRQSVSRMEGIWGRKKSIHRKRFL